MKMWRHWRIHAGMLTIMLPLAVVGCGSGESRKEIREVRDAAAGSPAAPVGISTAERLGLSQTEAHPPTMGMMGMAGSEAAAAFKWTTPEGWERAPDRAMRLATYLSHNGTVECVVSLLSGGAGGVGANLNRWRAQMGQPPLSDDAIAELPTLNILGRKSPMIDISGDYTGMSGDSVPGQRMLGAVCPLQDQVLFIKMVGPEAAVAAEVDHFRAFCNSITPGNS